MSVVQALYRFYLRFGERVANTGVATKLPFLRSAGYLIDSVLRKVTRNKLPGWAEIFGLRLSFPQDGYFGAEIAAGSYEPRTTRVVLENLKPGMVMVDVGAHVGYFTLVGARAVGPTGRVFAFEPDPITCSFLRANIDANGYGQSVIVSEEAVSETVTNAKLYLGRRDRVANSMFLTTDTSPEYVKR